MAGEGDKDIRGRLEEITRLITQEGEEYAPLVERLRMARDLFHEVLANRIAPSLNNHLSQYPTTELAVVKSLARRVNSDLRKLGVAIRHPTTGVGMALSAAWAQPGAYLQLDSIDTPRTRMKVVPGTDQVHLIGFPDRGNRDRNRGR